MQTLHTPGRQSVSQSVRHHTVMVRSAHLLLLAQPLGSLLQCFCFLHTAVPAFDSFELKIVLAMLHSTRLQAAAHGLLTFLCRCVS